MAYEQLHPEDRAMVAELLGGIVAPDVIDDLIRWTKDARPAVRIATMHALGSIGLDRRGYYYALRALSIDDDAEVRAMAARALCRSGRGEAAPYLARHLGDEWIVAAHAATGLRSLGHAGAMALRPYANEHGTSGDLARRILFEIGGEVSLLDAVAV
jgi:HEAT repeat protein